MTSVVLSLIIILCLIVAIVILRRRNMQNKPINPFRVVVPAMIVAVVLCFVYGVFTPQYYILRFKTPEAAYKFNFEMDCTHVVYGENSALATAISEDNEESSLLVLKDGHRWRILPQLPYLPYVKVINEGLFIYIWDKCPTDIYVEVIMTGVNPSSTKQIMLNDQAAHAEINIENKNINAYVYSLYYCLDGSTNEITVFVDGEAYGTVRVNGS